MKSHFSRVFAVGLVLAGCATSEVDGTETYDTPDQFDLVYGVDGDVVTPHRADGGEMRVLSVRRAQTLYFNFDGATIKKGDWAQDNAQTNTSIIPGLPTITIPPFNPAPWNVSRESAIATIIAGVQEDFAAFNVTITTSRPSSGAYTMVMFGGNRVDAAIDVIAGGIAPLDHNNWNDSDIAFIFTRALGACAPPCGSSLRDVAWVTSHEVGHSFGLNHIDTLDDIMYPSVRQGSKKWGEGPLTGGGGYQTDLEVLKDVLPDAHESRECGGLQVGEALDPNGFIQSCDGRYKLIMQTDGNLVLYGSHALWGSNTAGTRGQHAIMQSDGNLVMYDPNHALWASGTAGNSGAYFKVQDDGNLVIYSSSGHPLWASGTAGKY